MHEERKTIAVSKDTFTKIELTKLELKRIHTRVISFHEVVMALLRWGAAGGPGALAWPLDCDGFIRARNGERQTTTVILEPFEAALIAYRTAEAAGKSIGARTWATIGGAIGGLACCFPVEKSALLIPFLEQIRADHPRKQRPPIAGVVVPTLPPRVTARVHAVAEAWGLGFDETVQYLISSHPAVLLNAKLTPWKLTGAAT